MGTFESLAGKRASARRYASVPKPFSLSPECFDFVGGPLNPVAGKRASACRYASVVKSASILTGLLWSELLTDLSFGTVLARDGWASVLSGLCKSRIGV
jgi:hypothetical protein